MTTADRIVAALRPIAPGGKFLQAEVPLINGLASQWDARSTTSLTPPPATSLKWVDSARSKIGWGEIVGPKHNSWISKGWARLGVGWFNDDETPWCGYFVADCLNDAGLTYPKNFPSAASFKTYGKDSVARVGAIGVKARKGGNHVFFIVGVTADGLYYKALGGNQGNRVSIMDIRKVDVDAIRWPEGAPDIVIPLPVMPKGTISVNEA